jgi:lipopolysaccharide transport protein LptA
MTPRMLSRLNLLPLTLLAASGYADVVPVAAPILVEADAFHVDLQTEQAIWRGNVEATQGNTTFKAGSLTLRLEQLQAQNGTAAERQKTDGAPQDAYQLSADRVTYDLEAGQISGSGNSELRRGMELIRAQDIVYQVDQQKVQARPAANGRVQVQFFSAPLFGAPRSDEAVLDASGQTLFPISAAD